MDEGNGHDTGNPHIRIRIKHGKTARGGWSLSETTVELVAPLTEAGAAITHLMEGYLRECHAIGTREASRRNDMEGLQ